MMYLKQALFSFLIMMLYSQLQAQGPWASGKGHGFAQLSFSTINYSDIYNRAGDVTPVSRNNSDNTIQLYAETGLSKRLTAKLVVPITIAGYSKNLLTPAAGPAKASNTGLGNITGGIKYTQQFKHWLIAPGLDISLPAGKPKSNLGLRNGYENVTLLPNVSAGISGKKWYSYLRLSYGITTNGYNDYTGINAEGGYKVIPSLWLSLVADLRLTTSAAGAFGKAERIAYPNYNFTNFYVDDQEYIGIGLKAAFQFPKSKTGISAGVYGAAGGRNVAAAPSVNAGFFYKF
jgi:hypothetical protein